MVTISSLLTVRGVNGPFLEPARKRMRLFFLFLVAGCEYRSIWCVADETPLVLICYLLSLDKDRLCQLGGKAWDSQVLVIFLQLFNFRIIGWVIRWLMRRESKFNNYTIQNPSQLLKLKDIMEKTQFDSSNRTATLNWNKTEGKLIRIVNQIGIFQKLDHYPI